MRLTSADASDTKPDVLDVERGHAGRPLYPVYCTLNPAEVSVGIADCLIVEMTSDRRVIATAARA